MTESIEVPVPPVRTNTEAEPLAPESLLFALVGAGGLALAGGYQRLSPARKAVLAGAYRAFKRGWGKRES